MILIRVFVFLQWRWNSHARSNIWLTRIPKSRLSLSCWSCHVSSPTAAASFPMAMDPSLLLRVLLVSTILNFGSGKRKLNSWLLVRKWLALVIAPLKGWEDMLGILNYSSLFGSYPAFHVNTYPSTFEGYSPVQYYKRRYSFESVMET